MTSRTEDERPVAAFGVSTALLSFGFKNGSHIERMMETLQQRDVSFVLYIPVVFGREELYCS